MKTPLLKRLLWLPPLLWVGIIFRLSARPSSQLPGWWFPGGDKGAHAFLFAVLALLLLAALVLERGTAPRRAALYAVLLCAAYGALDEFHQCFVPTRMPDALDWAADVGGATLAFIPAFCLKTR